MEPTEKTPRKEREPNPVMIMAEAADSSATLHKWNDWDEIKYPTEGDALKVVKACARSDKKSGKKQKYRIVKVLYEGTSKVEDREAKVTL